MRPASWASPARSSFIAWKSAILPFRYVGKHRRAKLKDVLALKTKIDAQQAAMEALAEDAEDLEQRYGV